MNSRPLVCATEISSSKRSIHSVWQLGGRYTVQRRKGLELDNEISVQTVSIFEISISGRRLTLRVFLKYKITPPPVLFWVSLLSFRMKSKPFNFNCASCTFGPRKVSHRPSMSGHLSVDITVLSSSMLGKRCLTFRLQKCKPFDRKLKSVGFKQNGRGESFLLWFV